MEVAPPQELRIGSIIDATLDVLERNAVPAVIYLVLVAAANGAVGYFGVNYTSIVQELAKGVFGFAIAIAGAYLLFEVMLRKSGYLKPGTEDSFLPYVGLSILYSLGAGVGFILFIFPGLYIMARWSIAQPLLITRGGGIIEAMRDSWERTKGNEFSILVLVLVIVAVSGGISIFAGIRFEPGDPVGIAITQIVSSLSSVVSIALGVALYGLIVARREAVRSEMGEPRLDA